jgi:phage replication O-like protein O
MKKPDFSGGYTRILNAVLERVLCKGLLTQYESQIILAVARLTWGWNKKWEYSSYGVLAAMTGIARRKVYAVCKDLHARSIIVLGTGRVKTRFQINPDVSAWVLPRESHKNTLLPLQATPAVASAGDSTTPEPVDRRELAGLVKKFLKTLD